MTLKEYIKIIISIAAMIITGMIMMGYPLWPLVIPLALCVVFVIGILIAEGHINFGTKE